MVDAQVVEIRADGQCLLTALWSISTGSSGPVLRKERDSFVERAADTGDAALAATVSRAIDRLASRIAATIPGKDHRHAGGVETPVAAAAGSSHPGETQN
jgi:hypothetical protein